MSIPCWACASRVSTYVTQHQGPRFIPFPNFLGKGLPLYMPRSSFFTSHVGSWVYPIDSFIGSDISTLLPVIKFIALPVLKEQILTCQKRPQVKDYNDRYMIFQGNQSLFGLF